MLRTVTLDRASRKKDRSVSLTFVTQLEQTSEEFMEIDSLINTNGVIYFKGGETLTSEEINAIDSSDIPVEGKTKSQKLRNVLYVLSQQENIEDFKEFYANEMERIIEHYKNKLEKD
jgi:hypothetical protein